MFMFVSMSEGLIKIYNIVKKQNFNLSKVAVTLNSTKVTATVMKVWSLMEVLIMDSFKRSDSQC